jgi:hypothetical protein
MSNKRTYKFVLQLTLSSFKEVFTIAADESC